MSDWIIKAEGLGKRYQIQHQSRERYTALRDVIANRIKGLLGRGNPSKGQTTTEEFWALQDVSFEIKQGEVVGIIGRNGAGKSTLLKILSRITEPTRGSVRLRGRVASLLEVGTGFHPELTGRENIFLNGAILGMSRAEIRSKFDEIVAFAEVEKFLDTPVKRYSSGMYVRLAFAVAAHLEPEILVVDEVLAVGDSGFQEKCIGKMQSVAQSEGRTVLFVSHNLVAIEQLCTRALWLRGGRIAESGLPSTLVSAYTTNETKPSSDGTFDNARAKSDGTITLHSYEIENLTNREHTNPETKGDFAITVYFSSTKALSQAACGIAFLNTTGVLLTSINTTELGTLLRPIRPGPNQIKITIRRISFLPGNYTAHFWIMNPQGHVHVMAEHAISFTIRHVPLYGTIQPDHRWGCVYTDVSFTNEAASDI